MLVAATVARVRTGALGAAGLAFLICLAQATVHPFGSSGDPLIFGGVFTLGVLVGAAMCLARGAVIAAERRTWLTVGSAMTLSAAANVLYALAWFAHWPTCTAANLIWVGAYLLVFAALSMLVRRRLAGVSLAAWLDGAVGAFVIGALTALAFLRPVEARLAQGNVGSAAYLVFPVLDILLLMLVAAAAAHSRWQLRGWMAIGAGCLVMAIGDTANVADIVRGMITPVSVPEVLPLAGGLFFAYAAWQPTPRRPAASRPWPLVPALFGSGALGALLLAATGRHSEIALGLAAIAMTAVILRFALTLSANERMLAAARRAAATDALTGLRNRRKLLEDLERACDPAGDSDSRTLMLFDLNGFKHYNDTFGHQSGDTLLVELGQRLTAAVDGFGTVYRIGGDEFCLLTTRNVAAPQMVTRRAVSALSTVCDGLAVGAAAGVAAIPGEARTPGDALRIADLRMYENKRSGAASVTQVSTSSPAGSTPGGARAESR